MAGYTRWTGAVSGASSTVGALCLGRNARPSSRRPRGRGVRRASSPRPEALLSVLKKAYEQGKSHFIVVVAEGEPLSAEELHEYINESEGTYDSRLTVVGHIQRGGIPTASDRILASRLGTAAVEALADGETGVMVGIRGPRIERVPLEEVVGKEQPMDSDLYRMAEVLAELPE